MVRNGARDATVEVDGKREKVGRDEATETAERLATDRRSEQTTLFEVPR